MGRMVPKQRLPVRKPLEQSYYASRILFQSGQRPPVQIAQGASLDDLMATAAQSVPLLEDFVQDLAGDLDVIIEETNLKDHERALDKLEGECNGFAALLTDLVRCRIVAHDLRTISTLAERLESLPEGVLVHIRNRFEKPNERNHRDIIAKVRLSNDHVAEVQIHHEATLRASHITHEAYKVIRRINDRCSIEGNRFLTEAEQDNYISNMEICLNTYAKAVEQAGLDRLRKHPVPFPRYLMPESFLNTSYQDKLPILTDTV